MDKKSLYMFSADTAIIDLTRFEDIETVYTVEGSKVRKGQACTGIKVLTFVRCWLSI